MENRSTIALIVWVVSDAGGGTAGFEPGQRGTISLSLLDPQNGTAVEIQGCRCRLLASGSYPTPVPFTLVVSDGSKPGTIRLSTRAGVSGSPIPLPTSLVGGCPG